MNIKEIKKKKTYSLRIGIAGIFIGLIFFIAVFISYRNIKNDYNIYLKEREEIDTLTKEVFELRDKYDQEYLNNGFSAEFHRIDNEIKEKEVRITLLESHHMDKPNFNIYIPLFVLPLIISLASFIMFIFPWIKKKNSKKKKENSKQKKKSYQQKR